MTFSICIRTVPARSELFQSLLVRLVTCAPGVPIFVSADAGVSPNENGCLALDLAPLDTDWTLFLEDDAGPIDDFIGSTARWLADHAVHNIHLYPLGHPIGNANTASAATRWDISCYFCSVALAIRTSLVPSLTSYLRANAHVRTGFDLMAGHWHRTVSDSAHLLTPSVCLVDHLGDVSTLIDTRPARNVVGHFTAFRGTSYTYTHTHTHTGR